MQLLISLLLFCLQVAEKSQVSITAVPRSDGASLRLIHIVMLLRFALSD